MISIEKLAGDKIRKIIEFEDAEGNVQKIEIKNPTKKVRAEFYDVITSEELENSDGYFILEYLVKELTNIELTRPLKEIEEEEYVSMAFSETIKELSSIIHELVREFVMKIETDVEVTDAQRMLNEKIDK
mgnify:CR=1 FL=1